MSSKSLTAIWLWGSLIGITIIFVVLWCLGSLHKLLGYNSGQAVSGVSLYLTLVALIVTVFALFGANDQTKHLKEQADYLNKQAENLRMITASLSTAYIGHFPDHLLEVIRVIDQAKRDVFIMVDCVDYGSFSAPQLHNEVVRAIENAKSKAPRRKIKILVMSDNVGRKGANISRNSPYYAKNFDFLVQLGAFNKSLTDYIDFHCGTVLQPHDQPSWEQMLEDKHARTERRLQEGGADIRYCKNDGHAHGFFFWLRDDEEAVFLFPYIGEDKQELAFRTRDSKLLEIFMGAFNQNWKDAT